MSAIAFCPRGGQEGILTTKDEQYQFAVEAQQHALDAYIPLPDIPTDQQLRFMEDHKTDEVCGKDVEYWENERGSHGWCCGYCGKVHQWG